VFINAEIKRGFFDRRRDLRQESNLVDSGRPSNSAEGILRKHTLIVEAALGIIVFNSKVPWKSRPGIMDFSSRG
jgi:hypothetical protein